eukprot:TRINITY_DN4552_c0_g1_i1.p1 TRINITY_DN4552_c0_g1~~TRINITY_DN4552_c0_g1_i1.p1  ORF type:complete len:368 (+),score=68.14 TRINITY_DN4552_c0_g1_i1:120-1223(+)
MSDQSNIIILDIGSTNIRCGYYGDVPTVEVATVVGVKKIKNCKTQEMKKRLYIGNEAKKKKKNVERIHTVKNGLIQNYKYFTHILKYIFNKKMKINTAGYSIIVSLTPNYNPKQQLKILSLLFDSFEFDGVYFWNNCLLSLFTTGKTTGIVVDGGYQDTFIVPIVDGMPIKRATRQISIGGYHVTNRLIELLKENGNVFNIKTEYDTVNKIKENTAECSLNSGNENIISSPKTFHISENRSVTMAHSEYQKCTELIFDPSSHNLLSASLQSEILTAIKLTDKKHHESLLQSIIVTGGNSIFSNFSERLTNEIQNEISNNEDIDNSLQVRVIDANDKLISSWFGGSIVSTLPGYQHWIKKEDYLNASN